MEQPKNNLKIIADKKNARVILPNMLTLIGVCIGLTSIRFALDGKFEFAIIAIIFAALFDWLDGRIARLIKGTSRSWKRIRLFGRCDKFWCSTSIHYVFLEIKFT